MHTDTAQYNHSLPPAEQAIAELLATEIDRTLPEAENKVWHAHPVWFSMAIRSPATANSRAACACCSGAGSRLTSRDWRRRAVSRQLEARYVTAGDVNVPDLQRWLGRARDISGTTRIWSAARASWSS